MVRAFLLTIGLLCALSVAIVSPSFGAGRDHRGGHSFAHASAAHRVGVGKAQRLGSGKSKTPTGTAPEAGSEAPAEGSGPTPEGSGSGPAVGPGEPVSEPKPIWADEFNGAAGSSPDPSRWTPEIGGHGWGNEELEYNTGRPQNLATDGEGHLVITALRESYSGEDGTREYTSGRLSTKELFATEYGRIEARMKLPAGQGLWPAFWAEGANHSLVGWPNCGEIDVMESLGDDPYRIYGSIHGPISGSLKDYGLTTPLNLSEPVSSGFHNYGVDWSPGRIIFTFDGTPYAERDQASLPAGDQWVFDNHPFFLRFDLAVGGVWPGSPDSTTKFPAKMLIDWVRVWN